MTTRSHSNRNRGAALVLALAVLSLLVVMGFVMYRYSLLEQDSAVLDLDKDRALWDAKSGVQQAIAELQTAIASGETNTLLGKDIEVSVPVYILPGKDIGAAAELPVRDDRYESKTTVTISDECARMNINLAPPAVLMAILHIDGDKARKLRDQLPRLDGSAAADANHHWLASLDEFASLALLPEDALTPELMSDLTVHSALDLKNATGFINLNTASSAVIEAALGVTPDVAQQVIAARPLNSLEALTAAAGKDANGFNFKPAADNAGALPKELAFSSRCFRITSVARLVKTDVGKAKGNATVEAIVQFPENEAPRIVYWHERPADTDTEN